MCAIAGIIDFDTSMDVLKKMLTTMRRRGPDDAGICDVGDGFLLHARLAVIDPVNGKQPMSFATGDENYTIVYNGEIYNTPHIRKELTKLGHVFLSHSDTEVVLHSYVQWGSECVNRLNGIFAFAVWEHKKHRLFLARDRMGVKPLFYMEKDGGLLFASEIKTILTHPDVPARLDREGVSQILLLGPGRVPGSGVFYGMKELEPGECAFYENGRLLKNKYWRLLDRQH